MSARSSSDRGSSSSSSFAASFASPATPRSPVQNSSSSAATAAKGEVIFAGTTSRHTAHWPLTSTKATALASPFHSAPHTTASWLNLAMILRAATSHTATKQSTPEVNKYFPLGDHSTKETASAWPVEAFATGVSVSSSSRLTSPSIGAMSRCFSSSIHSSRLKKVTSFSRPGAASTKPSPRHFAPFAAGESLFVTGATVADMTLSPGSMEDLCVSSSAFSSSSSSSPPSFLVIVFSAHTVSTPASSHALRNSPFGSKETDLMHFPL
mmetsp:Transcript_8574/g.28658  ORF Transcript_8574/g.28658 Transcript_8574/m.28658 type:complete len:267 (-) Transcript_8574:535-1335(-)